MSEDWAARSRPWSARLSRRHGGPGAEEAVGDGCGGGGGSATRMRVRVMRRAFAKKCRLSD